MIHTGYVEKKVLERQECFDRQSLASCEMSIFINALNEFLSMYRSSESKYRY
jgi:hypothetical protein